MRQPISRLVRAATILVIATALIASSAQYKSRGLLIAVAQAGATHTSLPYRSSASESDFVPRVAPKPIPTVAIPTAQPDLGFVRSNGSKLTLNGALFQFVGLNIYNANSVNNCWYTLGQGPGLDQSLSAIGSGQTVFRAWFFQRLATTGGVRDWSAFDHTLQVAAAHNERVVATLANQWGDCEGPVFYAIQGRALVSVWVPTTRPVRSEQLSGLGRPGCHEVQRQPDHHGMAAHERSRGPAVKGRGMLGHGRGNDGGMGSRHGWLGQKS